MNCEQVRNRLSSYVDNELPADLRAEVDAHLESCPDCTDELAALQNLSSAAEKLVHPSLPASIWTNIEAQLDTEAGSVAVEKPVEPPQNDGFRWSLGSASIAASLLIALSLGYLAYHSWDGHGHDELAADFSEYLDAFQEKPGEAHLVLVNKYAGKAVELDQAHLQLGYKPTLASGTPDGYTIQTSFVMDMPCCKCIKTVCKPSDGGILAVFEHNDEQPIWFGDRPAIQTECGGKTCTLTQLNSQVAVSWRQGSRHLTVVGAKGVEEAAGLIEHFADSTAGLVRVASLFDGFVHGKPDVRILDQLCWGRENVTESNVASSSTGACSSICISICSSCVSVLC